ncbi:unnamed protein product, partial [Oppiella nova]
MASDLEVSESELHSNGNESVVKTRLVNRNPRNLEQLLFDKKPLGYELDLPQRTFWNKIVFESGGKHLTAKIVHNSGRVVVSASTRETAVGQQLKSSSGVSAATSLGHVLALRAIESGILEVFVGIEYESNESLKVKAFLSALKANGLVLEEQPSTERSTELNTNEVLVPTSVGAFVGNLVTFGDKSVSVFLGIPYAKPPLGSLRFKPPVPLTESTHRVSANRWPNPCLQKDNHL